MFKICQCLYNDFTKKPPVLVAVYPHCFAVCSLLKCLRNFFEKISDVEVLRAHAFAHSAFYAVARLTMIFGCDGRIIGPRIFLIEHDLPVVDGEHIRDPDIHRTVILFYAISAACARDRSECSE